MNARANSEDFSEPGPEGGCTIRQLQVFGMP